MAILACFTCNDSFSKTGVCLFVEILLGISVLGLEFANSFLEFRAEKANEEAQIKLAKVLSIISTVSSFSLLVLLYKKYKYKGKKEGATAKWYIFMIWNDPTTARPWRLYGSAVQLLGMAFGLTHLVVSIANAVRIYHPHATFSKYLGGFTIFPLVFAAFEACMRLSSLMEECWSDCFCSHRLFVYCLHRQAPGGGDDQGEGQATGAYIRTKRYPYFGSFACRCVHEGCHEGELNTAGGLPPWQQ